MNKGTIIFYGIVGGILGLPLSYYFQDKNVTQKVSLGQYMEFLLKGNLRDDLLGTVFLTVIILGSIFALITFLLMTPKKEIVEIEKTIEKTISEQLNELHVIKEQGIITEEEFHKEKAKLLNG